MKKKTDTPILKRLPSVDHFRGLALVLMIMVNTASGLDAIPLWMKHAPWDGFTFADAIAPMFLFAIGLTAGASFEHRRKKDGIPITLLHFFFRNILLLAFGMAGTFVIGKPLLGGEEILTLIGAAGIFCIPFWFIRADARVGIGALILGVFCVLNTGLLKPEVILYADSGLGGWAAIPVWGFIILFASWAGERFRADDRKSLTLWMGIISAILILSGIFGNMIVPLNKHLVSFSYILLSTGIALGIYLLFYRYFDFDGMDAPVLSSAGKNSLLIYITSSVIGKIFPSDLSLLFAIGAVVLNLVLNITLALILERKKIYIKL